MKKCLPAFLILVTALCGAARAQSQVQEHKEHKEHTQAQQPQTARQPRLPFQRWSIDVLAGPAFPVGAYGSLDHQNPGGGPIHAGGLAELSGTYHLNGSFGIVLLTGGQLNKGNGIPYIQPLSVPLTDPISTFLPPTAYGSQHWMIARMMTGANIPSR